MIDVHTHIIPGVDDGSPDLEDSLLMAELSIESGVDTVIATPHSHEPGEGQREHIRHIKQGFELLREEIRKRKLPLTLWQGMEIYCTSDMEELFENGLVLPMNGTDHYLIEFPFEAGPERCRRHIRTVLEAGGVPVIAHPERYTCIQKDPKEAERWIRMGGLLQINKGSPFGSYGRRARKAAVRMLDAGQVTFVGSDAHSPYFRTTHMEEIQRFLEEEYSERTARLLLEENARQHFG